jgi:hypothetical protein
MIHRSISYDKAHFYCAGKHSGQNVIAGKMKDKMIAYMSHVGLKMLKIILQVSLTDLTGFVKVSTGKKVKIEG